MKKHPELIAIDWLSSIKACESARVCFSRLFPDGMKMTLTNLRKYRDARGGQEIDFRWLAKALFNEVEYKRLLDYNGYWLASFWHVYTTANRAAKKKARATK